MKSGELGATERTIVESRGQQHAGHPGPGQRGEIRRVAHAAGRIQPAGRIQAPQLRQACQVGAGAGPDPRQRHGDHIVRPARRIAQQIGRSEKILAAVIQRQHAAIGVIAACGRFSQALAAQHRPPQAAASPACGGSDIGKTGIDPPFQSRMGTLQTFQRGPVIAPAENGIQVGNIEPAERIQREQPLHHGLGPAGAAQHGAQRPVFVTPAGPRAYHLPAHQVEHGNQA
ncbi:MAG: hypothetical protein BGO62_11910 [Thiobacillus sp. 65-1402]|nr:MAG: hypothetical protein BGO62_11910 [Thiobacillus sp. 65-1402]